MSDDERKRIELYQRVAAKVLEDRSAIVATFVKGEWDRDFLSEGTIAGHARLSVHRTRFILRKDESFEHSPRYKGFWRLRSSDSNRVESRQTNVMDERARLLLSNPKRRRRK